MLGQYARVRHGKITPIRYTAKHLKFHTTLATILSTGDLVIPLLAPVYNLTPNSSPTYRPPIIEEVLNKITTLSQLDSELFEYDLNWRAVALNSDGDIPREHLPNSVLTYNGLWDPLTNSPKLADNIPKPGAVYQVIDGYPEDVIVDLGSGPIRVRSGMRLEYRKTRWHSTGFARLSKYERKLLDGVMERSAHNQRSDGWGSDQGTFDIISYPAILEGLQGGVVVGQLVPVNCTRSDLLLVDNDGLEDLIYDRVTGEIFLDTAGVTPGSYYPKFMVGSPLSQSDPLPVRIDVLRYTLETPSDKVDLRSGTKQTLTITSPQDDAPQLRVIDAGGLWDVSVDSTSGRVVVDGFCCAPGIYPIVIVADGYRGVSDQKTVNIEVALGPDQPHPIREKCSISLGSHSVPAVPVRITPRLGVTPLDYLPLDSDF